ncbi:MAG: hypothetical protein CFE46_17950 [Burkholderiales bacterium PBB6]|nr:MAG: hypothetical protein CFE46_17950 [Burkholderiales bacterium PBB6]
MFMSPTSTVRAPAPGSVAMAMALESVSGIRLVGWAAQAAGQAHLTFTLRLGDVVLPAGALRRLPREDVNAARGATSVDPGFEIDLPAAYWAAKAAQPAAPLSLQLGDGPRVPVPEVALSQAGLVWWGAQALYHCAEADRPALRATLAAHLSAHQAAYPAAMPTNAADAAAAHPDAAQFLAGLDGLSGLFVQGWSLCASGPAGPVELWCHGALVDVPIRRVDRADVAAALGVPAEGLGFEIELPGALWAQLHGGDASILQLEVRVAGQPLGDGLVLERRQLWPLLQAADRSGDLAWRERTGRLVIEHLMHAGSMHAALPADRALALRLAKSWGWQDALLPTTSKAAPGDGPGTFEVQPQLLESRLQHWLRKRWWCRLALQTLLLLRRTAGQSERADRLEIKLTRATGLFDSTLYVSQLAPGELGSLSALRHYVMHGDARVLVPQALFDARFYTGQLPGRRHPGINRLLHYALVGRFEGCSPSAWFNAPFYLQTYADVRASTLDPLLHYLAWGWREGRATCPGFDTAPKLNQPLAQRMGRVLSARVADPRMAALLAGLPANVPRPTHGLLPWQTPQSLDGVNYLADAPWQGLTPRGDSAARQAAATLDVVVPVYAGAQETLRCLWSVLAAAEPLPFELVVLDDCSPEPALSARLRWLAQAGLISLHVNPQNLGFVGTVNRGLALHDERDVIILNSDTRVHGDWLSRITAHARRDTTVASITPMSNNATIFSYPLMNFDNPALPDLPPAEVDHLMAEAHAGVGIEVPTGMGFCMFLRRACMADIGLLDAERFGRGYGEENDWCMRASRAGWRHLAATDVYVEHLGSVSFQGETSPRIQAALSTLQGLYPDYQQRIDDWLKDDPLRGVRARLDIARLQAAMPGPVVLMVSHDRGGGTARHETEEARRLQALGRGVLLLRPSADGQGLCLRAPDVLELPNLGVIPLEGEQPLDELISLLQPLAVEAVQLHHLVDFPLVFRRHMQTLVQRLGVSMDVTLHDYHLVCPRINLVNADGQFCGEPVEAATCDRCVAPLAGPTDEPLSIVHWRRDAETLLRAARQVRVPDDDVAQRMARYFPGLGVQVAPHDEVASPDPLPWAERGPVRHVAVIGALGVIKGYEVVRQLALQSRRDQLGTRISLLGYSMDDAALTAAGVHVLGRYDDTQLPGLLARTAPDLILLPSIWPETYSYVLSAAIASGCRVAVFDIGAPARRLRAMGFTDYIVPLSLAQQPRALWQALGVTAPSLQS